MTRQEAIQHMIDAKKVSIPYMQKTLKLGYEDAKAVCDCVVIEKRNVYLDRMNEYLSKLNE
jgi:hypothetical protein